ncbi:hypothetical protein MJO28_014619 [Puccinia striiformis f. sp. tritici]|uniref:Uncharacterized protein n=1 Tax=Puccinia striiformis f. sp. tritici TaxID=168172 RepID=A0ACC0DUF8_9BASI|nr:hypothetical protein MJO28_014619 [Puccinia striiformis f. sp. tritici]
MVIPGKIYIKAKTDILIKQVFVIYLSSLDLPPHNFDNKKDIIHSAIGLPPCSVLINTSSSEDEDHEVTPHLLITTQTKLKPSRSPLPTIKQTIIKPILKSTSNQPCEDLNDDDQELFITGISDLDHVLNLLVLLALFLRLISYVVLMNGYSIGFRIGKSAIKTLIKLFPEWKVKSGCILIFIKKIKKKKRGRKDRYLNWIRNEDQVKPEEE